MGANLKCVRPVRNEECKITGYIIQDDIGINTYYNIPTLIKMLIEGKEKIEGLELVSEDLKIQHPMLKGRTFTRHELKHNENIVYDAVIREPELKKLINKTTVLGGKIEEIITGCGNLIYLLKINELNVLYIPNNVVHPVNVNSRINNIKEKLKTLTGNLKVIGGSNVVYMNNLFENCRLDILDLTELDMRNVESLKETFKNATIKEVLFSDYEKQLNKLMELTRAFYMFKGNIRNFENLKIIDIRYMTETFELCEIPKVNLNNIDIVRLEDARALFFNSKIETLDISNWELYKRAKEAKLNLISKNNKVKNLKISERDKEIWDSENEQLF